MMRNYFFLIALVLISLTSVAQTFATDVKFGNAFFLGNNVLIVGHGIKNQDEICLILLDKNLQEITRKNIEVSGKPMYSIVLQGQNGLYKVAAVNVRKNSTTDVLVIDENFNEKPFSEFVPKNEVKPYVRNCDLIDYGITGKESFSIYSLCKEKDGIFHLKDNKEGLDIPFSNGDKVNGFHVFSKRGDTLFLHTTENFGKKEIRDVIYCINLKSRTILYSITCGEGRDTFFDLSNVVLDTMKNKLVLVGNYSNKSKDDDGSKKIKQPSEYNGFEIQIIDAISGKYENSIQQLYEVPVEVKLFNSKNDNLFNVTLKIQPHKEGYCILMENNFLKNNTYGGGMTTNSMGQLTSNPAGVISSIYSYGFTWINVGNKLNVISKVNIPYSKSIMSEDIERKAESKGAVLINESPWLDYRSCAKHYMTTQSMFAATSRAFFIFISRDVNTIIYNNVEVKIKDGKYSEEVIGMESEQGIKMHVQEVKEELDGNYIYILMNSIERTKFKIEKRGN
ncbi:MAG: hypothetical protein NT150_02170 [Bacteroidetes bacterium]|nr:hypothetical protein [Bacteroidota bacterium]